MKGKRYTTEDKIWILREADRGEQTIQVICREANISEVTFHRWKKQFGQLEVNEARRLKELERENTELKKMLAESLLKNRVLEAVCELWSGPAGGGCGDVLATGGMPDPAGGALDLPLSGTGAHGGGAAVEETAARVVGGTPARLPTEATHRGHVWTWDFIADATVRGGALRLLTILDEHTRECHVLWAERALRSQDLLTWLQKAIEQHGAPEYLRSDNGSEFIAKIVQRWLAEQRIKTIYIEPSSPWQNGFEESFHGRFRDECLNREQLWTLTEARVVVSDYRRQYNELRPHSRLGYESPAAFAARNRPFPAAVGLRPPSAGDGQRENQQTT
jgi:transposase InsO family protein